MANYRKIFRLGFKLRCEKCNTFYPVDNLKQMLIKNETNESMVPLSARSASGYLKCPKDGTINFTIDYSYEYIYRKRCKTCHNMFEDNVTYNSECKQCR